MDTYQTEELHLFRRGCTYGWVITQVDHLGKGFEHLQDGKLAAWTTETMRAHGLCPQPTAAQEIVIPGQPNSDANLNEGTSTEQMNPEADETAWMIVGTQRHLPEAPCGWRMGHSL
jgi:hypothetical protein